MLDLAQRAVALASEHGSAQGRRFRRSTRRDQRPLRRLHRRHPDAVCIRHNGIGIPAAVPDVAGDFSPDSVAADEVVRVRVMPTWLRIDARFGSVYRRRDNPSVVLR
jgi:hypothetical protein